MKKYKLKKDLPLAKAGDYVYVLKNKGNSEVYRIYEYLKDYQDARTGKVLGSIDFKDFGEWLEEIEEKVKSVWDLEGGDYYFVIKASGIIDDCIIYNYELMNKSRELGNVFVTREEAEKELKKRKAIQKIKKYCWENSININNSLESQTFYSNSITGNIEYTCNFKNGNPIGYFSCKDAEKILEKFEDELKIILDV